VIATLIPCSRRATFSKLNGLTCFLAPLLPAPQFGSGQAAGLEMLAQSC
jgi:hypothetical protein